VEFRNLGPATLRNILAPMTIFEVAVAARRTEQADLDPVCQMRIDPVTTAAHLTHQGRTYHFCSRLCPNVRRVGRAIRRVDVDVARSSRRTLDLALPSLALLMCGWLLLHTGWSGLVAAAGLAVLGLALGHRLPDRGTDVSPPAPDPEGARTR
jgi:YHS domain-containing protein